MHHPTIQISSLRRARHNLETGHHNKLIAIGAPGGTHTVDIKGTSVQSLVRLYMWDATPWHTTKRRELPTGDQVLGIIEFARSLEPRDKLLIHCQAGRSRSTATALIVLAARHMPVIDAVDWLKANYPKSTPNGWMLWMADGILGTNLYGRTQHFHRIKGR